MTGNDACRVLLVEDNLLDARTITKALGANGTHRVEHVEALAAGLEAVNASAFDCVLLDLSLPDSDGLVSVETMVARSPHCPVVVLTGLDDPDVAIEAVARGAQDYLVKGTMTPEVVARAIRYAVARHSAEIELSGMQQRLQLLQEREQIARDLHDTVIQRLFASGMSLQAATRLPSRDELADRAMRVVDEIDEAIRELREAIFGLHTLDEAESLTQEVASIVDSHVDSLGFAPVVRLGDLPSVPDDIRQDLLAVVRESLANVAKHAKASTATLTIAVDGAELKLRVTDNGKAAPPATPAPRGRTGHGLANMANRATAHGGSMAFEAGPNGGSELTWTVPIS